MMTSDNHLQPQEPYQQASSLPQPHHSDVRKLRLKTFVLAIFSGIGLLLVWYLLSIVLFAIGGVNILSIGGRGPSMWVQYAEIFLSIVMLLVYFCVVFVFYKAGKSQLQSNAMSAEKRGKM